MTIISSFTKAPGLDISLIGCYHGCMAVPSDKLPSFSEIQSRIEAIPTDSSTSPEPAPMFSPGQRPGMRLNWRLVWARLRYGRRPQFKISKSWWPLAGRGMRKYWWALVVLILLLSAAGLWFFRGVQQKADWKQATDYYRRADYKSAAPILLDLPLPDDAEQLRIYGQTMQATNHLDKAVSAYSKLYEVKKDPFAKLVLGNIYNQQKRYDQAEKAYKELIDANPTYIQAYVNLATVYRLQGQNQKALDTAKAGLQNNPNNVVIAELAFSLTAGDWESDEFKTAKSTLERINPNDPLLLDHKP